MTALENWAFVPTKETYIAGFTLLAILLHLVLKYALRFPAPADNLFADC